MEVTETPEEGSGVPNVVGIMAAGSDLAVVNHGSGKARQSGIHPVEN
jgi:hypothetical protein